MIEARGRGWLLAVGVAVGAGIFLAGLLQSCARDRAIDRADYEDCRQGNEPRAYIRLVLGDRRPRIPGAGELPPPGQVLPILSCQETIEEGRPIRLSPRQEARYLQVFRRGRLPTVRKGRVVGSEPFPVPARSAR